MFPRFLIKIDWASPAWSNLWFILIRIEVNGTSSARLYVWSAFVWIERRTIARLNLIDVDRTSSGWLNVWSTLVRIERRTIARLDLISVDRASPTGLDRSRIRLARAKIRSSTGRKTRLGQFLRSAIAALTIGSTLHVPGPLNVSATLSVSATFRITKPLLVGGTLGSGAGSGVAHAFGVGISTSASGISASASGVSR